MTTDWLGNVVACEPCVHNDTLVCLDCARAHYDYPNDISPSNEFDTPQHCNFGSKCINSIAIPNGRPIGTPLDVRLTKDGVDYIRNSSAEHVLFGSANQKCVSRLWLHLYNDVLNNFQQLVPLLQRSAKIPPVLRKSLGSLARETVLPEVFTDLHCVYGGASNETSNFPDTGLGLWRLSINSQGQLIDPTIVYVPRTEIIERSLKEVIDDAISEGAWS